MQYCKEISEGRGEGRREDGHRIILYKETEIEYRKKKTKTRRYCFLALFCNHRRSRFADQDKRLALVKMSLN